MTISEVKDYIAGLNRRHRTSWEQSRILYTLIAAMSGNDWEQQFPWDETEESEDMTDEEIEALQAKAKEMERKFNANRLADKI